MLFGCPDLFALALTVGLLYDADHVFREGQSRNIRNPYIISNLT